MIDLYTWTTPNGRKVSIMLEEIGLPYKVIPVDLATNQQLTPALTAVNPNQKIPALVDNDAQGGLLTIFESGAILIYLAEKTGKLLPTAPRQRSQVLQWLMYQMSHVGPIIGQAGHFVNQAPEKIPYAMQRFINESLRIIGVLNGDLAQQPFLAGDYSIADIATYPWIVASWTPFTSMMPDKAAELAHVKRWMDVMGARPAVQKGMAVPSV